MESGLNIVANLSWVALGGDLIRVHIHPYLRDTDSFNLAYTIQNVFLFIRSLFYVR